MIKSHMNSKQILSQIFDNEKNVVIIQKQNGILKNHSQFLHTHHVDWDEKTVFVSQ